MCWDLSELVQAFEENMIGSERAKDFKWLASLLLWLIVGTLSAFQSCASSSCVTAHKLKKQMSSGKYARNTSQDSVFTSKRNSFHFAVNFLATSGTKALLNCCQWIYLSLIQFLFWIHLDFVFKSCMVVRSTVIHYMKSVTAFCIPVGISAG